MRNLKNSSLYSLVYKEIRDYIISNKLQVGDKLPTEIELTEMLGVSRNVVREALKALQLMGILTPVPSKGYVVSAFSFDSIYEQVIFHLLPSDTKLRYEMDTIRTALEVYFVDEAIDQITPQALETMQSALSKMEDCCRDGKRMGEYDRIFHTTLFANVDNQMFHSIEKITWDLHPVTTMPGDDSDLELTLEKHKELFFSIVTRDKEQAKTHLRNHLVH